MIFVGMGRIDVKDGAFCVVDEVNGERMLIPVGSLACLLLEPGTRVSHAAVKLAATVGTLLIWVGDAGVRLYASGQPGGARSDKLLYQAKLALDDDLRLKVVRKMFELRFGESAPSRRSIEQLRGIEGARVRKIYELVAKQYGVKCEDGATIPRIGKRRYCQPMPERSNSLPLWNYRSRYSGRRIRAGNRLSSFRQTFKLCL